jgi:large subunit ribosomal protein L25
MPGTDLHAELRNKKGDSSTKALRRQGKVPAVFYIHDEDTVPISVDEKELHHLIQKKSNILDVIFPDGKVQKSILREVQKDPVTDHILHVDLMGIKLTEKVRLTIPVVLMGTPAGVKEGGILEHLLREVEVEGLPLDIPDRIEIDVSNLNIGHVLTLKDVPIERVRVITSLQQAVANVVQPKVAKVETAEIEEIAQEEKPAAEEPQT